MALGYVRPARPSDINEVARIQLETWRTAYRRIVPREILASLELDQLRTAWSEAVTRPPSPRHRVLIAIEQSEEEHIVGFAAIQPAEEDEAVTNTAALTELLVEPRWGRRGHGSRLLAASVAHWRDDHHDAAIAWVFDQAPAPKKFLASAGWEPDGAHRSLDMADVLVPQIRLHVVL